MRAAELFPHLRGAQPPAFLSGPEAALAAALLREAASLCRHLRGTRETVYKADASPVTLADYGSQAIIGRGLAGAFPLDPVVAEEGLGPETDHGPLLADLATTLTGAAGWAEPPPQASIRAWINHGAGQVPAQGRWWTLDPIDGTKGYIGGGQYALALALMDGARPVFGLLACPALPVGLLLGHVPLGAATEPTLAGHGSLLAAWDGQGAWAQDLDSPAGPWHALKVSRRGPVGAPWCESLAASHSRAEVTAATARLLGLAAAPIRADSQVKYALVASGLASCCLRVPRGAYVEKVWDHAAGALILAEAGGAVSDLDGKPFDYGRGRGLGANRGMALSSGVWHDRLLDAVRAAEAEAGA